MTIGPAPMIRMLLRSVRLGILGHQPDKSLEEIMAVLRAGARLGVVLHREYWLAGHPQSFVGAVEQRKMRGLHSAGQALGLHDKPVVLAGYLDLAGQQVLYRVIGAPVAARHLARASAERQRQQLVAEADAED